METDFYKIKKNGKVKLWRVMPLIFLIFQKLMIFSPWLHIHSFLRVAHVMQCFCDFDHPLKTKFPCKALTQVRKIVTNHGVNLHHAHLHTDTHSNFRWHPFRFHYIPQLASPSGGANAVPQIYISCVQGRGIMMNGPFASNYIKPTLANTIHTPQVTPIHTHNQMI